MIVEVYPEIEQLVFEIRRSPEQNVILWLANCYFAHFPQDPKLNVTLLQCAQKLPEDQFARDTSSTLFLSPTYGGLTSWYPGFVRLGDDWQRVAIVRVMCSIYALSDRQFYRPRFLAVD